MFLVKEFENNVWVSTDTIKEFEKVISSDSIIRVLNTKLPVVHRFYTNLFKVTSKLGFSVAKSAKDSYIESPLTDAKHVFTIMMGLEEFKICPFMFNTNHCKSIYLFDAWADDFDRILHFINYFKIDFTFVSASQSAERLNNLLGKKRAYWVPEGINPNEYKFKVNHTEKGIDVLALGRRYENYHIKILESLKRNNFNYSYVKEDGQLIFPSRQQLIEGFSNSKISVCFPASITTPSASGGIETMTIRYLQSIVSKCLIVGHAPDEMIQLFGYNPVVEVDFSDPAGQIISILNHYDDYLPLIERNFEEVITKHTWECRWNLIKEYLSQNHFEKMMNIK